MFTFRKEFCNKLLPNPTGMSPKILVTGANGHLGANIVRSLLKRNYEINAFVRKDADLRGLTGLPVTYCYGDILDPEALTKAALCSIVINASNLKWKSLYFSLQWEVNLRLLYSNIRGLALLYTWKYTLLLLIILKSVSYKNNFSFFGVNKILL